MKVVLVAGPLGSGKTAVLTHLLPRLADDGPIRYAKVDCLRTDDPARIAALGVPTDARLAGPFCPDHELAEALPVWVAAGLREGLAYLVVETAGLCDRCTPFVQGALALLVIDLLSSVHAPRKMRAGVGNADVVVTTKGELVSPAEREIRGVLLRRVNPALETIAVNGLTGEGSERLAARVRQTPALTRRPMLTLRQPLPGGYCATCQRGLGMP